MFIAVATDDYMSITGHVGRCNGFLVYAITNNEITGVAQRENQFTHHKLQTAIQSGHSHSEHHGHSHMGLIDGLKDCSCLIALAAGRPLVQELLSNGIDVVLTTLTDPQEAALLYAKGELKTDENAVCSHH
ncbi:MAG: NifB/NifX family molybdenum-iron cluster-binding protein [bacterium]